MGYVFFDRVSQEILCQVNVTPSAVEKSKNRIEQFSTMFELILRP